MIVTLLEIPRSVDEWNRWTLHHRYSHAAIRRAILTQKGVNLPEYVLDPINFERFTDFLQNNQQSHYDMLGVLGIQGEDLQDVNIKQESQLEAWVNLHYQDHYNAENALKIGS